MFSGGPSREGGGGEEEEKMETEEEVTLCHTLSLLLKKKPSHVSPSFKETTPCM